MAATTTSTTAITTLILLTFSLLAVTTTSITTHSIKNAAEILSNTGFTSVSLILPLISTPLLSSFPSSTFFAPLDESFSLSLTSGQPSLTLLQFHFCPRFYSFPDLQSLSYGSRIPTLNPNFSLIITSSAFDDDIFINGVRVRSSPVFDDGFLVVYGIDRFFKPNFTIEAGTGPETGEIPSLMKGQCAGFDRGKGSDFSDASRVLRSKGYSLMAGFLDVQLMGFNGGGNDENALTIFAPKDVAMKGYIGNFSDMGSVFLRYVIGCELSWEDLVGLSDGFVTRTFLGGFHINITRNTSLSDASSFSLMLNGQAYVDFPELYRSERVVVHGLSGVLVGSTTTTTAVKSSDHESAYPTASADWKGVQHVDEF